MKYIAVAFLFLLTGCITIPVKHAFPKPPPEIVEKCPSLYELEKDQEKLSEFLKVVSKNYALYYECSTKHESLVKWVKDQSAIHDDVFNKGK